MAETIRVRVNGRDVSVSRGASVAAAIALAGFAATRRSVSGEARAPLCGMGTCFECRARVDGRLHVRTCRLPAMDGMEVETDAG